MALSSINRGVLSRIGAALLATSSLSTAGQFSYLTLFAPGFFSPVIFGSANVLTYIKAGTYSWTCPANVFTVRLRVWGGGGSGGCLSGQNATGGAGGSFAAGVYQVTPGVTYTITVAAGGLGVATGSNGNAGGTSSFGSLLSAAGGLGGNKVAAGTVLAGGAPGALPTLGNLFNFQGGRGGNMIAGMSTACCTGGGAAGTQLGNGGRGGDFLTGCAGGSNCSTGGGGVGGNAAGDMASSGSTQTTGGGGTTGPGGDYEQGYLGGASATGFRCAAVTATNADTNSGNVPSRFPGEIFTGGGSSGFPSGTGGNGGPGGGSGGTWSGVMGVPGVCGGCGASAAQVGKNGGLLGGGSAGSVVSVSNPGGDGGVILEF